MKKYEDYTQEQKERARYISQEVINKYNLNSRYYFGSVMELINTLKPKTEEEWKEGYLNWANNTGQSVRLHEALYRAEVICKNNGVQAPREEILQVFYKRIISDTWIGRKREIECAKRITEQGFIVETVGVELDMKYGVDLMVYNKEGELQCGVQVKGRGYFNKFVNRERDEINPKKYQKFKKVYGKKVYEVCINDETGEIEAGAYALFVALGVREKEKFDFNFM